MTRRHISAIQGLYDWSDTTCNLWTKRHLVPCKQHTTLHV